VKAISHRNRERGINTFARITNNSVVSVPPDNIIINPIEEGHQGSVIKIATRPTRRNTLCLCLKYLDIIVNPINKEIPKVRRPVIPLR
jgi:hypothetical protein